MDQSLLQNLILGKCLMKEEPIDDFDDKHINGIVTDLTSVIKIEENEVSVIERSDLTAKISDGIYLKNNVGLEESVYEDPLNLFNSLGNVEVCDLTSVIKVEDVEIPSDQSKPSITKKKSNDIDLKKTSGLEETVCEDPLNQINSLDDDNNEGGNSTDSDVSSTFEEPIVERNENFNRTCYNCKEELPTYEIWFEHNLAFKNQKGCFPTNVEVEPIEEEIISNKQSSMYTVITKLFKCPHCDFKTFYKPIVQSHYENTHGPKLCCALCPKLFKNVKFLKKHINYVHLSPKVLFKCKLCDYTSKQKEGLTSHQRVHSSTFFNCTICDFRTKSESNLKSHFTARHTLRIRQLRCAMCPYIALEREGLQKHLLETHSKGPKNVSCTQCLFKTTSSKLLQSHVKNMHIRKPIPYHNCYCGYQTKSKNNLISHRLKEHSCKTFSCKDCSFETVKKEILFIHCNLKHQNRLPLECHECSHIGQNISEFKTHIYRAHNPFPLWFYCAYCNFKAFTKIHVASHISFKHSQYSTKFKCKECKYSAKTKLLLKQHVNIRHNPNPIIYYCAHCTHKNKVKFKLAQHIKEKHLFVNKKRKKKRKANKNHL